MRDRLLELLHRVVQLSAVLIQQPEVVVHLGARVVLLEQRPVVRQRVVEVADRAGSTARDRSDPRAAAAGRRSAPAARPPVRTPEPRAAGRTVTALMAAGVRGRRRPGACPAAQTGAYPAVRRPVAAPPASRTAARRWFGGAAVRRLAGAGPSGPRRRRSVDGGRCRLIQRRRDAAATTSAADVPSGWDDPGAGGAGSGRRRRRWRQPAEPSMARTMERAPAPPWRRAVRTRAAAQSRARAGR